MDTATAKHMPHSI